MSYEKPSWSSNTRRGPYHLQASDWIRSGKAACGQNLRNPGFVIDDPNEHSNLCKHCLKFASREARGSDSEESVSATRRRRSLGEQTRKYRHPDLPISGEIVEALKSCRPEPSGWAVSGNRPSAQRVSLEVNRENPSLWEIKEPTFKPASHRNAVESDEYEIWANTSDDRLREIAWKMLDEVSARLSPADARKASRQTPAQRGQTELISREMERLDPLRRKFKGSTPIDPKPSRRKRVPPSYKKHDPKGFGGDPPRGAALGRDSLHTSASTRLHLQIKYVSLDSGGYDSNGTYFGLGEPLWWVTDGQKVDYMIRAANEHDAIEFVKGRYPRARIQMASATASDEDVEVMADAFIEALLWSENDESDDSGGEPLDSNYSASDLDRSCAERIWKDCKRFLEENLALIGTYPIAKAGHDFCLERNGHGTGFWDRDELSQEQKDGLTAAAQRFGELHAFAQDGKVYCE